MKNTVKNILKVLLGLFVFLLVDYFIFTVGQL